MPRAAGSGAGLSFGDGTPVRPASPAPSVPGDGTHRARSPCPSPLPHSASTTPRSPTREPPGGVQPRPAQPRCRWHKGPSVTPPLPIFSRCRSPAPAPGTRVTPPRIPLGTPATAPRRGRTGPRGPERPEGQRGTAQGHRGRRAGVPRGPGCGLATPVSPVEKWQCGCGVATARGARGGSSAPGAGTVSPGGVGARQSRGGGEEHVPGSVSLRFARGWRGARGSGAGQGRSAAGERLLRAWGVSPPPPLLRGGQTALIGVEETEARAPLARLCRASAGSRWRRRLLRLPWRWRRVRP